MNILVPHEIQSNIPISVKKNSGIGIVSFLSLNEYDVLKNIESQCDLNFAITVNNDALDLGRIVHLLFKTNYFYFRGLPVILFEEDISELVSNKLNESLKKHGFDDFIGLRLSNKHLSLVYNVDTYSSNKYKQASIYSFREVVIGNRLLIINSLSEFDKIKNEFEQFFFKDTLNEFISRVNENERLYIENQWLSFQLKNHKQYIQVIKNRYGSRFSIHFFINKNNKFIKAISRFGFLKKTIVSIFNLINKIFQ